ADHLAAKARQRFRQQAAAAADVEDAQAAETAQLLRVAPELACDLIAYIGHPDGIELVQHRHGTALVPPLRAKPSELIDLFLVDGRGRIVNLGHLMSRIVVWLARDRKYPL